MTPECDLCPHTICRDEDDEDFPGTGSVSSYPTPDGDSTFTHHDWTVGECEMVEYWKAQELDEKGLEKCYKEQSETADISTITEGHEVGNK